ncbi:MAG: aminoacyl-tRNA hydrolase [Deltaproteobacteria bacterium]|nr:aminoacyl-tRNA hydrolase [Deltaproteobacteria bacterium]
MADDLQITEHLVIPAADLAFAAVRSSGPGGQHVNTTSTKVELRFDLAGTQALSEPVKARLRSLCRGRLDAAGAVVITSQDTRSQIRNMNDTREKLAELIRRALVPPKRRKPTKPTRGSKERRLDKKKQQGEKKRLRSKID